MLMKLKLVISFIVFANIKGEDLICSINGKKAIHQVSDKFLGISIDPAVLLTGLNLSSTSLELAKYLGPAFIRIAGPSTQFIKFETEEESQRYFDDNNIVISPSMWLGINQWLNRANLTPVFGINDFETTNGVWNPKSNLPLLETSDKFNISCFWQLGYDCSNKTELQYKDDLLILKHILEAFPERKHTWKIIGSDLNRCKNSPETPKLILENMKDVLTAVMWEPNNFIQTPMKDSLIPKPKVPTWTTAAKETHPVSFLSAILWAKQIGEAARLGFEVIFRQPRLHEIFSDTPAYWVSILFKTLMGRNVLDVKRTGYISDVLVYAHCTKKQNSFVRRGAITVLIINNSTENQTTLLRLGVPYIKNTEVQSYVLTSPSEDSTIVYLNGNKLGTENFKTNQLSFTPKLRRAKVMNFLTIQIPAKSIGFYVVPSARIPACINDEEEMQLLMEEIREDQKIPFSEEVSFDILSRNKVKSVPTLRELHDKIEKELESDEEYYRKFNKNVKRGKKRIEERVTEDPMTKEAVNFFKDLAKMTEKPKADEHKRELRRMLERKWINEEVTHLPPKHYDLELTSAEIRKILADRAKLKAAKKNIIFTSVELDELMKKATEKFLKNRNTAIRVTKAKRSAERDKKDINMKLLNLKTLGEKRKEYWKKNLDKNFATLFSKSRNKRDINMNLLKLKTETLQNLAKKTVRSKFENKETKEATIRQPDQTSEELLKDETIEEEESDLPSGDIFAELATSESVTEKSKPNLFNLKPAKTPFSFSNLFKPVLPKFKPPQKNEEFQTKVDLNTAQVLEDSDEFDSDLEEDHISNIHEFQALNFSRNAVNEPKRVELWEMADDLPVEEKDNKLPSLISRGLDFKQLQSNAKVATSEVLSLEDYDNLESEEHERSKRHLPRSHGGNKGLDDDRFFLVIGKPYESTKIKIDENWKTNQIKLLKTRLAHKKKMDMMDYYTRRKQNRKIRSIFEMNDIFKKGYESITKDFKVWKPSDILNLTKPNGILRQSSSLKQINDSPVFKIFVGHNTVNKIKKRNVDIDVNSTENEIGSFTNEIARETKLIQKELDNNRDYQLIFPNKDQIELTENRGNIDLKFVHNSKNTTETTIDFQEYSPDESTEIFFLNVTKRPEIQDNVFQKLFHKLTDFLENVGQHLKTYFDFMS